MISYYVKVIILRKASEVYVKFGRFPLYKRVMTGDRRRRMRYTDDNRKGLRPVLPETYVRFQCEDPDLQRLFDIACRKCRRNLTRFGDATVLVEGGGYEKLWLETQPMGGEMYAKQHMEAALNNQLLFMKHQRADGRLPGSIQRWPDGRIEPQFNKLQGFCFPWPALNMYYWIGEDRAYLDGLCKTGAEKASYIAAKTLRKVYKKVGLVPAVR